MLENLIVTSSPSHTGNLVDYSIDCPFEDSLAAQPECIEIIPVDHPIQCPEDYVFAVGDCLEIGMFGDKETYVKEAIIAPDGKLYYLFLKPIPSAGHTLNELSQAITAQLDDYYVNPSISILPKTAINKTYRILGGVNHPGIYPLFGSKGVKDAIADAEKSTHADLQNSFLIRNEKRMALDLNAQIIPGDYLFIASEENRYVYVLNQDCAVQQIAYKESLTTLGALAMTYGDDNSDSPSKLLLIRGWLKQPCVMQIDLSHILAGFTRDVFVLPGDILYIQDDSVEYSKELIQSIQNSVQRFIHENH